MTSIALQSGNNMPLHAPLIPDPFVPYQCPGNRSLNAVCRGDPKVLNQFLANTPFVLSGDLYLIYVADFTNCDKVPFMDAGIVIPVEFQGETGGYFVFEYEDNDEAIAAGRDLWGYPKKYADINLLDLGDRITGSVTRRGVPLFTIECTLDAIKPLPVKTTPHFNIHLQPTPEGGVLSKRVIRRDTSADFRQTRFDSGSAIVSVASLPTDPVEILRPLEVLGANYVVGDFFATEQNGWGKTIAQLV